jgi:hypothetical protein
VIVPEKPALHVQALGTSVPSEPAGHGTGWQDPLKNGNPTVAVMFPEKPASHMQPLGTFFPDEPNGHGNASQDPEKKG